MSRARSFCFTINTFDENTEAFLQSLDCRYIIYGYEVAPSTGRPHLQGYVYFDNARSFEAVRKLIPGHLEIAKGAPEQNFDYCSKDGNFFERGERPLSEKGKAAKQRDQYRECIQLAASNNFADMAQRYPDIFVRHVRNWDTIVSRLRAPATDLQGEGDLKVGEWHYGPRRSGKSRYARTHQPLYTKMCTKWWNGYNGEPYVLIEDFSSRHVKEMVDFLKIWTDRYAFPVEVKNGHDFIRPLKIFVTSNFSMQDLFEPADLEPLLARFTVTRYGAI
jgi:hypothetical protein